MSSSTIPEIANALESALETIDGLRTAPFLSDSITPPLALVAWDETVAYHSALAASAAEYSFTIFLIVARSSDRAGIEAMETYASLNGPMSIRAAIEADPTLGGVVSTLLVEKSGPPTSLNIGQSGVTYLSLPFTVTVYAE